MSLLTTAPMPATVYYCSSSRIIFHITTPSSPLYLSMLTVTPNPPGSSGIGNASPGTATAPVTHTLALGNVDFGQVHDFVVHWHGGFILEITYDTVTLAVSDFICAGVEQQLATERTLEAISTHLGTGVVTDGIHALNQTVQALLQAVHHLTHVVSRERGLLDSQAPPSSAPAPSPGAKPEHVHQYKT